MKKAITIFFILACAISNANESKQYYIGLFKQANQLYADEKFSEAIEQYNEVIGAGYQSSELYFNIGNAYYKKGKLPEAILFYERAKKLAPADDDIEFNLEMANQQITDKVEPIPQLFYKRWLNRLVQSSSADNWAIMAVSFLFIGFVLLALFLLSGNVGIKKLLFSACVFVFAFACISYLCGRYQYISAEKTKEAIVFSPSVKVYSEPKDDATTLFVIHEGTKVKVMEEVNDWQKISLANGNIGWLQTEQVEEI